MKLNTISDVIESSDGSNWVVAIVIAALRLVAARWVRRRAVEQPPKRPCRACRRRRKAVRKPRGRLRFEKVAVTE